MQPRLTHPSPNHDRRPVGGTVEKVILHYTGMASAEAALCRLRDERARVSAHYLLLEDGQVLSLVREEMRAWHAGQSVWRGRPGLNDISIGIEIVNPGHAWGYRAFPKQQLKALVELVRAILERWELPPSAVLAHSDVAPDRKQDPGELLDWRGLAEHGVGLWPAEAKPSPVNDDTAFKLLNVIGYPLGQSRLDQRRALVAFQRRFRPSRVDGVLDPATMGAIAAVARLYDWPKATTSK